jgi:hypothetical protein
MGVWEKGSVKFRRFTAAGKKPPRFDDDHLARLREYARPPQPLADGSRTGWAAGEHPADAAFDLAKNVFPDHLLWELWREEDKPPADRLKVYRGADLAALVKEGGNPAPTAKQRRQATESARERITAEARDGRWKKWTTVPVLWGLRRNDVYLGSTSAPAAGRFAALFEATFGKTLAQSGLAGELTPVTAGVLARGVNRSAKGERLTPFLDVPAAEYVPAPEWHADDECPDWLGCEFLVWLWWTSEDTDTVPLPDGSEVTFLFSGGVKFQCPLGQTGDTTANHASGVRTPEARAALRSGKLPRKACLTLVRHGQQFQFKLQPERMEVSGLKLPRPDPEMPPRDRHVARLEAVEDMWECLEQLFVAFLNRRLTPEFWEQESRDIRGWVQRRRKAA